jgi:hypothetical protein
VTSLPSPLGLTELYAALGRRLSQPTTASEAFDSLCRTAVQMMPGASDAGITRAWSSGRRFETVAATGDLPRAVDRIQYDLRSGPCVDAATEHTVFRTGDLRTDPRWPEFGRRASEETGTRSMLSVRLYTEGDADEQGAALNMYACEVDAFDDSDQLIGTLLASHGALAVAGAAARQKIANLEIALGSNRQIGVAIGILMAQYKITEEAAFDLLRIVSQHTQRKISDIAPDVVRTGTIELPDGRLPGREH